MKKARSWRVTQSSDQAVVSDTPVDLAVLSDTPVDLAVLSDTPVDLFQLIFWNADNIGD
jgi:hypothetical protein